MQIGYRWTRMYLIEKHMCRFFLKKIIILTSPFAFGPHPVPVILPSFIKSYVWLRLLASCHTVCEIIQMRTPCFFCLPPRMASRRQGWQIHKRHFSPSPLQPPPPSPSPSPWIRRWERPGHYEKPLMSVWRGVLWCATYYSHSSEPRRHLTGGQPTGCVII